LVWGEEGEGAGSMADWKTDWLIRLTGSLPHQPHPMPPHRTNPHANPRRSCATRRRSKPWTPRRRWASPTPSGSPLPSELLACLLACLLASLLAVVGVAAVVGVVAVIDWLGRACVLALVARAWVCAHAATDLPACAAGCRRANPTPTHSTHHPSLPLPTISCVCCCCCCCCCCGQVL
jgi:hypothetical protein